MKKGRRGRLVVVSLMPYVFSMTGSKPPIIMPVVRMMCVWEGGRRAPAWASVGLPGHLMGLPDHPSALHPLPPPAHAASRVPLALPTWTRSTWRRRSCSSRARSWWAAEGQGGEVREEKLCPALDASSSCSRHLPCKPPPPLTPHPSGCRHLGRGVDRDQPPGEWLASRREGRVRKTGAHLQVSDPSSPLPPVPIPDPRLTRARATSGCVFTSPWSLPGQRTRR